MPNLKRRDRIVIFRLTQDEYESLKNVCARRGARNISDFARSALLLSIERDRPSETEQRLMTLQSIVERMSQLLERIAHRYSEDAAGEPK
jgi:hypothetical protein